jgi:hypothetical protein
LHETSSIQRLAYARILELLCIIPHYDPFGIAESQGRISAMGKPRNIGLMLSDINLAISGLCYADIAEIRDVISAHRHELWGDMLKWPSMRSKSSEEKEQIRLKIFSDLSNELDPIGQCNRILNAIAKFEEEMQGLLNGKE